MDNNVTYNAIPFSKSFDDATGSRRQSNARGISTPDIMTVKHMDFVDNEYKTASRRHTIRFDQVSVDALGAPFKNTMYLVTDVSNKSTTALVNALVATVRASIANTTAGTDVIAAVLNNES